MCVSIRLRHELLGGLNTVEYKILLSHGKQPNKATDVYKRQTLLKQDPI